MFHVVRVSYFTIFMTYLTRSSKRFYGFATTATFVALAFQCVTHCQYIELRSGHIPLFLRLKKYRFIPVNTLCGPKLLSATINTSCRRLNMGRECVIRHLGA